MEQGCCLADLMVEKEAKVKFNLKEMVVYIGCNKKLIRDEEMML